jgi:hypothetical protein
MAKRKLNLEYDFDFIMLGIACYNKDYMLCSAINNKMKIDLMKVEDLVLIDSKTKQSSGFARFSYEDEDAIEYNVIANAGSNKSYLIPEHEVFDYFLVIKNTNSNYDVDALVKDLKEIQIVILINKINPNNLKSKGNLILDN